MSDPSLGSGCIVCTHISHAGLPIKVAVRSRPSVPEDSGWQFVCDSGVPEDESTAQIWRLDEVIAICPNLTPILAAPVGTSWKQKKDGQWQEM